MKQLATLKPSMTDTLGEEYTLSLPMLESRNIQRLYRIAREAYLDLYVRQHPCPSWKDIARMLRNLRLHQQAVFVENAYVKGQSHQLYDLYRHPER